MERRMELRYPVDEQATAWLGAISFRTRIADVSRSGMRLQSSAALPSGATITVRVTGLIVDGTVRHCRRTSAGLYEAGLQITQTEQSREWLMSERWTASNGLDAQSPTRCTKKGVRDSEASAKLSSIELQRLAVLLDSSSIILYACDIRETCVITFISENVKTVLGHNSDAFINDRNFWKDHVHSEDLDRARGELSQALATGKHTREYRFRNRAGEYRWIQEELTVLKDSHEMVVQATDITSYKRLESELRQTEERYALTLDTIHDGIFECDVRTGASHFSVRFKTLAGYGEDEMSDDFSSVYERLHPDDRASLASALAQLQADASAEKFVHELRLKRRDDGYRWVLAQGRVLRDEKGHPVRIVGSICDVTDSREAVAELAASKKRLTNILDSLFEFVGIYALDGTVLDVNHAALEASGFTADEVIGKFLWDTDWCKHSVEEQTRARQVIARAAQGEIVRFEATTVTKRGGAFISDVTFGPLCNDQGIVTSIIGFGVDITARKEAESQLLVAKQAAEASSRAKSEFLANMGHEIRTPMNAIIGLTEIVLESELGETEREHLGIVKTSAESLLRILSDLLEISKIQAGKLVLRPREFCVRDLVDITVKTVVGQAQMKQLPLIYRVEPAVPNVVLCDSACFRQVLLNLIENAIKFTQSGEVLVSVGVAPENPGQLQVTVRDTGIGIPADKQEMIFEPFSQVDSSFRRQYGGTGLGLAISAQLVEMMGGRIWVTSDGNHGSTFSFTASFEGVEGGLESKTAAAELVGAVSSGSHTVLGH